MIEHGLMFDKSLCEWNVWIDRNKKGKNVKETPGLKINFDVLWATGAIVNKSFPETKKNCKICKF